jgi:uncharacterized protein YoxC
MILEISVASIAITLLVWMVCFIIFLSKTSKTIESARKDIHEATREAIDLMGRMDSLVSDIQSKSDSLDVVFRPLKSIGKRKLDASIETVSEIVEWVGASLALFNKAKNVVQHRKSRR